MYTTDNIKPIPKYILKLIEKRDNSGYSKYASNIRFYSYLTRYKNELLQVTVACKNKKGKWYCKQVAIHGLHAKRCFVKDIVYFTIAGYKVGWYEQGLTKYRKWYESENWDWADDKYFNVYAPVINPEYALKFKELKYSAVNQYPYYDILKYLRIYEKYP